MSKPGDRETKAAPQPLDLRGRVALRISEAAQVLGICENTLRQILPELPHFHIGKRVLLPVEPLLEWARERAEVEMNRVDATVDDGLRAVREDVD